jgi:hypothetical protein
LYKEDVNVEVQCENNSTIRTIFDKNVLNQRSLFPINFYGDDTCKNLSFNFDESVEIKDIYIYGK